MSSRDDIIRAPPMGWNSFNSYGVYLHEAAALANVEALAARLKPHGYRYFVIDNGWFGEYQLRDGTLFPAERHASDIRLNEYGYFLPSRTYFPNGFYPIMKRCCEYGLEFGVHLMRGIPRKAVELNLPIKDSAYHARDVVQLDPAAQCNWCRYCYGVDMRKPGAQAWYDGLIRHVVDLGATFIKYDDIVPYPDEIRAVATAIQRCGRPVALSLSPGRLADEAELDTYRMANMLRVTPDIWDDMRSIDVSFEAMRRWQGKERPGFWIDLDMIPFGQLQLMSPDFGPDGRAVEEEAALAGKGHIRWSAFTPDQMRTFIVQRALTASPLMMGGDLPSLDEESFSLIAHPEIIACNQNGVMGSLVFEQDDVEVWRTPLRNQKQSGWIGVFNRGDTEKPVLLIPQLFGFPDDRFVLRSAWNDEAMRFGRAERMASQGVLFLKYEVLP